MPTLNLSAVNYSKFVDKTHTAVELENDQLYVVLLPEMGRVYSIRYKPTGHDVLWRNDIAWPGGANNKLGWWLWIGGIEYTLPGEEHGYTWALPWNWTVQEDSSGRKAIHVSVDEPSTGLTEEIVFSLTTKGVALRSDVTIRNPTSTDTAFAHWTNVPFVPGGTNQVMDDTVLQIPTKSILIADRWQKNLGKSPQSWPDTALHSISGWGGMGDFMVRDVTTQYQ